MFTIKL